jgi:hypothetical protein
MADIGPIGFIGGLNTKAGAFTLAKDQMPYAQNVHVIYGKLTKINGSATLPSAALNSRATVTGLFDWQSVAQVRNLITVCGNNIYKSASLSSTFSAITGAATVTAGNIHTFSSLNNYLAVCGGTDTPLQWQGSGNVASLSGSPPVTSLTTTANNFMFLSGNTTNPSRVYWSNVGDPTTWTGTNYVDFRLSDGDIVTAIAPMGLNLIIFKRRSTGIFYTQTNTTSGIATLGPLTQINTAIGCAGPLAWDSLPDGRMAMMGWDNHLYIFDGSNFTDISDQPWPSSNVQPTFDTINPALTGNTVVKYYPVLKQIWVSIATGGSTTNNYILVYDYLYNTWQCIIPDRPANVMTTSIDTRGAPHHPIILVTGDYIGEVYEHDYGTSNAQVTGGIYNAYGQTCTVLGTDSTDFIPRSIRANYDGQSSGQLQIGWGFNDLVAINNTQIVSEVQTGSALDSTFELDVSVLSGGALIITPVPISNNGRTYTVQVQFLNNNTNQLFSVHPFYISDDVIA